MPPRILILTAAFGEGHNSAAKNLALALGELGAEARVEDPCLLGAPAATRTLSKGYRLVTTYSPRFWELLYKHTGDVDFSKQRLPLMRRPEREVERLIEEFQPQAIVSTYPLYPYFLERIFESRGSTLPSFTVVTDSIEVNPAWTQAPTDGWLVTDAATRTAMIEAGLDAARITETGFPVNPSFSRLTPVPADDSCDPFKVIYFTTAKVPHVRRIAKAILNASPRTQVTLVLGKNVRLLYAKAHEIKERFPGRVTLKGWTRKVPQLLNSHHLVIGKAGGATVHEAIAACCPMLVHHLVPGQEEGNLALLRQIGGGEYAPGPEAIGRHLSDMLADRAGGWRAMKHALSRHGRNAGALAAARFVLGRIGH
ncbi:MGDG synthase family glycosyltransferase [Haloferula sargassicola]|uniref:Processive diacylglycerol beta-glucosyltransferase n=1 Tax=Haloferula sargassicola TaxID=490096 RepID=A0ABP9UNU3_9BACT